MQEYIRFMNRKNRKTVLKVSVVCALAFFTLAAVAFLNTRFNGFADVHPAAYYFEKIGVLWQKICDVLFLHSRRFINFFN